MDGQANTFGGDAGNNNSDNNGANSGFDGGHLETSKSERHVWLMKCSPMVSRFLNQQQQPLDTSYSPTGGPVAAKVIVTVDPLLPTIDFSSTQFTVELVGTESGNVPKCYSMDMSTDFIPMSVFSDSSQGRVAAEGKIYHKFDMKPRNENIEQYGKLCRERTNKSLKMIMEHV